jgi:hypothetical protein
MKRLWILLLLSALPGCASFEDYSYEEGPLPTAPASCGCQTPTIRMIAPPPGSAPTVSQMPAGQTREPALGTHATP